MNIYNDYMNIIKEAVDSDSSNYLNKGLGYPSPKRSNEQFVNLYSKINENKIAPSLRTFSDTLGKTIDFNQELGSHPSFIHLKSTSNTEEHYIVSAFFDIKGSTNLFKKFDKETVFLITNAILKAGIHTALIFGGYVHRLQGDGIFVYFGNKSIDEKEAVSQALQAVSVYTYFVKNDLKEYLQAQGIENISIRSGIDLGYDKNVLWGNSGIGEISEITTCSLHTSLASKMQSSATSNGVVVGQYVKDEMMDDEYFSTVTSRTGSENDRYIYRIDDRNFYYTQYDFKWEKFLKKQNYIATDQMGRAIVKTGASLSPLSTTSLKPIADLNKPYFSNE
jgi:adenylate cyclase